MKQIISIGTLIRIIVISALLLPLSGCLTLFCKGNQAKVSGKATRAEVTAESLYGNITTTSVPLPKMDDHRITEPQAVPAVGEKVLLRERSSSPDIQSSRPIDSPAAPASDFSADRARNRERLPVVTQGDISYENSTLTEDVNWRGTVLIRGWLVIASKATVRIEPGTVVRFMKSPILRQAPVLVVQGRIQCNGTPDSPVLFTSNFSEVAKGDWGGILLLSSGKRNQFENIRIEGAITGIEAHFSTLVVKGAMITRSTTGMLLRDGTSTLTSVTVNGCETGIESHDSEVELRESSLVDNRRGVVAHNSTLVLLSVSVRNSIDQGVIADQCRIRFSSCDLSDNGGGTRISGGEGQISETRFTRNRGAGLHLSGARIRIHRSLFAETVGDGIRMDDGRSVIWNCIFSGNSGYNLVNAGQDEISAVQNWWGSNQEDAICAKLSGISQDVRKGRITIAPWLQEKPEALP